MLTDTGGEITKLIIKRTMTFAMFCIVAIAFCMEGVKGNVQRLQRVLTPRDFCHVLLCYNVNLKIVTYLHKIPHNDKVKTYF